MKDVDVLKIAAATLSLTASSAALAAAPEPRDAAAVIAKDDAWGDAELRGDGDFVDQLLLPGYRSVGSDGRVTAKDAILEHARARRGDAAFAQKVAEWKRTHPSRAQVEIIGDTAILTWVSTGAGAPIRSCDIFVYRDGQWRAVYSQHTAA